MRGPFIFIGAWLALAAFGASAATSQPTAGDESEIVIEGVRERRQEIQRFVDALTDAPVGGQIARFDWKVCPVAIGLSPAQNIEIGERMRRVAAAAGVPLADPGCNSNAILIVTPDKAQFLRWMRREYPNYFRDPLGQRIWINEDDGPATAWQVEGQLTHDGLVAGADTGAGDASTANHYVVSGVRTASRLVPHMRPHFIASILVVEASALRALSTRQLADYAAMRIFARTDPARLDASNAPTILRLLDAGMDDPVPVTLTQWDLSFLRALYGSAENQFATRQRHQMRLLLGQDLEEAGASEND